MLPVNAAKVQMRLTPVSWQTNIGLLFTLFLVSCLSERCTVNLVSLYSVISSAAVSAPTRLGTLSMEFHWINEVKLQENDFTLKNASGGHLKS